MASMKKPIVLTILYSLFYCYTVHRFVEEVKEVKFVDPVKSKQLQEILNRFDLDDSLNYVRYDSDVSKTDLLIGVFYCVMVVPNCLFDST